MRISTFLLATACALFAATLSLAGSEAESVDYETQIKPILRQHCAECHGMDDQQSGLRVDAATLAIQGGDRGPAIVPGDSAKSILYQAIVGEGDVEAMPYDQPKLPPAQIELIRRWIDEGAKSPAEEQAAAINTESDHWAFQPIVRPGVPEVSNPGWIRSPIDAFVSTRLTHENLQPSERAERAVLVRRLSLDLLGLPPTAEEVDRYLSDKRPGSYERLVDRLLASPHYGEKWGRHWLDAARYADSNGYPVDGPRSIWRYRDWVINAINADLPFDQFTIEQLAGDMLPDASLDQTVATGFHRNTLFNQEGGVDAEEFRIEAVADRVDTTGTVFLGLTVGCARCHDHKYDPVSQREYYRLFAIFNNCDEPNIPMPTRQETERIEDLTARIADAKQAVIAYDEDHADMVDEWVAGLAQVPRASWDQGTLLDFQSKGAATFSKLDDGSLIVTGTIPPKNTYDVVVEFPLDEISAIRVEALTHDQLPHSGPGLSPDGDFVLSEIELHAEPAGPNAERFKPVEIAAAVADWSPQGYDIGNILDRKPVTGWSNGTSEELTREREFILRPKEVIRNAGGSRLRLRFHQLGPAKHQIGRLRISATSEQDELAARLPESVRNIAALPAVDRTAGQHKLLEAAHRTTDEARATLVSQRDAMIAEQNKLKADLTTTMVLKELEEPRTTHIHIRGDFLRAGAAVEPGVPTVLHAVPENVKRVTRLEFAKWLCDPSNPLTARVIVNRSWQRFFGTGLVNTEDDFGTQGDPPSHPELLDWLASELIARNWSMKSLHRLMVTSATYRQSSRLTPGLLERDPTNRLLARQSRLRLQAEAIRDASLAACGLLSEKVGGTGVYPPQPEGIYVLTQQKKEWELSTGEDRYRRGMYTYFWRSSPYPFLTTFDAPNATTTCTRRARSNTPLQALTLANDQVFFECAQSLGAKLIDEAPDYDTGRIQYAFRTCLGREPSDPELTSMLDFLERQREHFRQHDEAARLVGFEPRTLDVPPADAAAWTAVARVFLNLDEFITRE